LSKLLGEEVELDEYVEEDDFVAFFSDDLHDFEEEGEEDAVDVVVEEERDEAVPGGDQDLAELLGGLERVLQHQVEGLHELALYVNLDAEAAHAASEDEVLEAHLLVLAGRAERLALVHDLDDELVEHGEVLLGDEHEAGAVDTGEHELLVQLLVLLHVFEHDARALRQLLLELVRSNYLQLLQVLGVQRPQNEVHALAADEAAVVPLARRVELVLEEVVLEQVLEEARVVRPEDGVQQRLEVHAGVLQERIPGQQQLLEHDAGDLRGAQGVVLDREDLLQVGEALLLLVGHLAEELLVYAEGVHLLRLLLLLEVHLAGRIRFDAPRLRLFFTQKLDLDVFAVARGEEAQVQLLLDDLALLDHVADVLQEGLALHDELALQGLLAAVLVRDPGDEGADLLVHAALLKYEVWTWWMS